MLTATGRRARISSGMLPGMRDYLQMRFRSSVRRTTNAWIMISEIDQSLEGEEESLFFDSLPALTVYRETDTVNEFSRFLVNKLRENNIAGVLVSLKEEVDQE